MKKNFRRFGTMIDCSRNAVLTVDSIKKWIDITSDIGYNTIMIYMEDTYEIKDEPFFGHLRGRYSEAELKEIDDYANNKGMEFIPCIQTLAHLNAIFHWKEYKNTIWDCDDILLAEEESTYRLIEKMFETFSQNLRTKIINIGMDEAHFLGLGRYLDKHGYKLGTKILTDHLKIVSDIAKKYGFELLMWGDMFVRLANGGEYYVTDFKAPQDVKDNVPDNIKIVYWDYYSFDKEKYDNMIKVHTSIKEDIWFAGGLWTWGSPVPRNGFSNRANKTAIASCIENGVQNVFFALWGDDGAECSIFAALPSLYYAAQIANGINDETVIKKGFLQKYGIEFDDYMLLDLIETPTIDKNMRGEQDLRNPEKYMLYCDCFMGQYDYTIKGNEAEQYALAAKKIKKIESNLEYGYLFAKARALCELLSVKYDIGVRTRKAYLSKDINVLKLLISDYDKILDLIEEYHRLFKSEWLKENKPHGFDIQDIRLGGLSFRVRSCRDRLQLLVDGKIERIEELEEPILNLYGANSQNTDPLFESQWYRMVSANVISHNVF